MARTRYHNLTVEVDVDISEVLEDISDDEWVDILKGTDDKILAKAGLQRIPDVELDPLTEHLQNMRAIKAVAS